MTRAKRGVLERAILALSEQAAKADAVVDEALAAGLDGSHPVTLQAKILRLELLNVKADLERELGRLLIDCSLCSQRVHWVAGLRVMPGHWAHAEPAPHHAPGRVNGPRRESSTIASGEDCLALLDQGRPLDLADLTTGHHVAEGFAEVRRREDAVGGEQFIHKVPAGVPGFLGVFVKPGRQVRFVELRRVIDGVAATAVQ